MKFLNACVILLFFCFQARGTETKSEGPISEEMIYIHEGIGVLKEIDRKLSKRKRDDSSEKEQKKFKELKKEISEAIAGSEKMLEGSYGKQAPIKILIHLEHIQKKLQNEEEKSDSLGSPLRKVIQRMRKQSSSLKTASPENHLSPLRLNIPLLAEIQNVSHISPLVRRALAARPAAIPFNAFQKINQSIDEAVSQTRIHANQSQTLEKQTAENLLQLSQEIVEKAKKSEEQGQILTSDQHEVKLFLREFEEFRRKLFLGNSVSDSDKMKMKRKLTDVEASIDQATERYQAEIARDAEKLSMDELKKRLSNPSVNSVAQPIYADHLEFKIAHQKEVKNVLREARSLSDEMLLSWKDQDYEKHELFQEELKQRAKRQKTHLECFDESQSSLSSVAANVGAVRQSITECLHQVNTEERLKELNEIAKQPKVMEQGPIDQFPEILGIAPYFEAVRLLKEYLSDYTARVRPPCIEPHTYSDVTALYQSAHTLGYPQFTPIQTDYLLSHVEKNRKDWKEKAAREKKAVIESLVPWPTEPIPRVVIKPDGQMVLLIGEKFLGSGTYKDAWGLLSLDLSDKDLSTSASEHVMLKPGMNKKKNVRRPNFTELDNEVKVSRLIHKIIEDAKSRNSPIIGLMDAEVIDLNQFPQSSAGETSLVIIQEKMGFDLSEYFKIHGLPEHRMALRVMTDAAEGIVNLHRNNLVHGDIKEGNLLIKWSIVDMQYRGKVGDYGEVYDPKTQLRRAFTPLYAPVETFTSDFVSQEYQDKILDENVVYRTSSPEFSEYRKKWDVYSWGMMALHTSKGSEYFPYNFCWKKSKNLRELDSNCVRKVHQNLVEEAKTICGGETKTCLFWLAVQAIQPSVEMRPSMEDIFTHLKSIPEEPEF